MGPGRELDALIAEKVMGWEVSEDRLTFRTPESHPYWRGFIHIPDGPMRGDDGQAGWSPSTDIAAAWQVAQKIKDMDEDNEFIIHLSDSKFEECEVEIKYWDDSDPKEPILAGPFYILGKTAPHAICLAALKAVESV